MTVDPSRMMADRAKASQLLKSQGEQGFALTSSHE
jgi:hypothetical protein